MLSYKPKPDGIVLFQPNQPKESQCTNLCDKECNLVWSSCAEAKEVDFQLFGSCMIDVDTDELACLDGIFEDIAVRDRDVDADSCMQALPGHNTQAQSNVGSGDGKIIWPTSFEPEVLWSDPAALPGNVLDPFHGDWPYW